jgi:glycosyltransferase involved in cell wall biosynthesis
MTVQLQDRAESGLLPVVTILLATYNGERYLREQIDSLLAQTHPVRVLARDDGSRDGTVSILRDYAERWPQRFALLEDDSGTGHAKWNFLRLTDTAVQIPGIDYLAFADQDDVWMPEKIELEMKAMRQLEKRYGATVPLLVFSDLSVVAGHAALFVLGRSAHRPAEDPSAAAAVGAERGHGMHIGPEPPAGCDVAADAAGGDHA